MTGVSPAAPVRQQKSDLCWICRKEPATSREHKIKRSDIFKYRGPGRFFIHKKRKRNILVQAPSSHKLTFGPTLCVRCNSSVTQPHDRSWSEFMDKCPKYKAGDLLDWKVVFPKDTFECLKQLYLFLSKSIGCSIVEANLQQDLTGLSEPILHGRAPKHLYIGFFETSGDQLEFGDLDVCYDNLLKQYDYFLTVYITPKISLGIMYVPSKEARDAINTSFFHAIRPMPNGIKIMAYPG